MNTYTLKSLAQKYLSKFTNFRDSNIYSEADFANAFNACLNEMYSKHHALILHTDMTRFTGRKTYVIGAELDAATGMAVLKYTHI